MPVSVASCAAYEHHMHFFIMCVDYDTDSNGKRVRFLLRSHIQGGLKSKPLLNYQKNRIKSH